MTKARLILLLGAIGFIPYQANAQYGPFPKPAPIAVGDQILSPSVLSLAGSMAQLASGGGWDTTLSLVNTGAAAPAEARLNFVDDKGNPLLLPFTFPQVPSSAGPLVASTLDRTLNPNSLLVIDSQQPGNPNAQVGSAQLVTSGNVGGFAIFKYMPAGQEAVVTLETRNAPSYVLAFDNTGLLATGVAIANVTTQPANIPIIIRDDTGSKIGAAIVSLTGQGHTSFLLADNYAITRGKRGTIEFDTPLSGQITALGLRTNGSALTTLPLLADVTAGGGSMAQVASGGGWQTTFTLVNTGSSSAQAQLSFFDDNGNALSLPLTFVQSGIITMDSTLSQTIAAGATSVILTQGNNTAASVGSAQLTTTGNVSGFAIIRYNPTGQEAVVPLETRDASAYVLAFDNTNGLAAGLALANVSNQAANVPLVFRDDTGASLGTATIHLAAHGHTSFMLTDSYTPAADKRGTVEFDRPAGTQISVLGLRATPTGALTTIPVLSTVAETGLSVLRGRTLSLAFTSTLNLAGSTIKIEQPTLNFSVSASPQPDGMYKLLIAGDSGNTCLVNGILGIHYVSCSSLDTCVTPAALGISGNTATFSGPQGGASCNYIDNTTPPTVVLPITAVTFSITFTDLTTGSFAGNISLNISPPPAGCIDGFDSACSGTLQGTFTSTLPGGIGPSPVLSSISPATASPGQTVTVTIQGQETNFAQGTTQVGAGPGITAINVAVVDRTHLTAQFTVDAAAVSGSRTVTATTGAEEAVLLNGFEIVIQSPSGPFTYTSIDPPASTSTIASGVNTSGHVVGYYTDTSGMHGFLMSAGAFSAIDFSGASATTAAGINSAGQIVGTYVANGLHGFLLAGGSHTTLDFPGIPNATPSGINNSGQIVGSYNNGVGFRGFVQSGNSLSSFAFGDNLHTEAYGINDFGSVVGIYADASGNQHGFLRQAGVFTSIDVPGASFTNATGINNAGKIVGFYGDSSGVHGFLLDGGFKTFDFPGTVQTQPRGISDSDQIVGDYAINGTFHGFIANVVVQQ